MDNEEDSAITAAEESVEMFVPEPVAGLVVPEEMETKQQRSTIKY